MPTPDNLNSAYLGQPGSSDNLNTPFLPETASEATINARSDISTVGQVFSQGAMQAGGAFASASALSVGEITATGGNFSSTITSTDPGGDFGSVATAANDTGMADGAFRFVNTASGISLAYRSGGTTYYMGASTISEA